VREAATTPRPSREREGRASQAWEGEGTPCVVRYMHDGHNLFAWVREPLRFVHLGRPRG
jgi:hypothetical protein